MPSKAAQNDQPALVQQLFEKAVPVEALGAGDFVKWEPDSEPLGSESPI